MPLSELPLPATGPVVDEIDQRLAALLEAAPDALVCLNPGGRIAAVNGQVATMFGYQREQLLGAEVEILLPEALRAEHVLHRADFTRRPHVRSMAPGMNLVARRRDGSGFPVEVSLVPWLAREQGWVIAAIRDVTEQRALEAATAESEARLRQIAESVGLVFVLMQPHPPKYLYVSPGAQRLSGVLTRSQVDPELEHAMDLLHPDDRAAVEGGFMVQARAGLPAESEHRLVTPSGEIWVRAVATPVQNEDGPPQRTVITVEDITDRVLAAEDLRMAAERLRTAEAEARAANQSKNQFLSRMSHELRTPLNAVLGFGQLLERQLAGTEHADAVDYVLKGARHLLELINDVLDVSRIESGKMSLSVETINLAALVQEIHELMCPLATASQVTLVPPVGDRAVLLQGDRNRVRQILLNLLSNAIKYNKDGGRVWLTWAAHDDVVQLSVRDEGAGIAPELHERLFQPFDRLGAEGGDIEGAGIGLALSRSMAALMGGAVDVQSAPGHGATFTLTLPAGTRDEPDSPPTGTTSVPVVHDGVSGPDRAGTATLLYIEDNEPNVQVIAHLLALRPGWTMIHAALGGLGVELARAHLPDLVLLDLHLPDLDGSDVLRALKGREDTKAIPVVILSADASPGLDRKLVDAGAERFLTKPLDVAAVLALLDDITRGPAAARPLVPAAPRSLVPAAPRSRVPSSPRPLVPAAPRPVVPSSPRPRVPSARDRPGARRCRL